MRTFTSALGSAILKNPVSGRGMLSVPLLGWAFEPSFSEDARMRTIRALSCFCGLKGGTHGLLPTALSTSMSPGFEEYPPLKLRRRTIESNYDPGSQSRQDPACAVPAKGEIPSRSQCYRGMRPEKSITQQGHSRHVDATSYR